MLEVRQDPYRSASPGNSAEAIENFLIMQKILLINLVVTFKVQFGIRIMLESTSLHTDRQSLNGNNKNEMIIVR